MGRKDALHSACKNALVKDGWIITHDPYRLRRGGQTLYVDLGAEFPIAAEKSGRKIAVEVKSLLGGTEMPELERALGQFVLYRSLLRRSDPDRSLYLAVTRSAYLFHFDTLDGENLIEDESLQLLVFLPETEEIDRWIEAPNTN
ncbi:MAG: hypothetical protein OHK0029_11000 [Armatimonadaceae bacterium]